MLRPSETHQFGWDNIIFPGTNPNVSVADHTNSRGVNTVDTHVPLAGDDDLFWHNSEETLNFFTANASDTQNEVSTGMLSPTGALQELVDIDEELKGPTNRAQPSLLSQIITPVEETIVNEERSNGYRCPVPTCTWSQASDTSPNSLEKTRKKFKPHFHTHNKEARMQALNNIPLSLIGDYYVCNECAQLFRTNNDGTVRSHACAPVTLPCKLVRSSSESGVNTPSPTRPPPSITSGASTTPSPTTTPKSHEKGYLLDGLARGSKKLAKRERYRPYNAETMTLTKNVNSTASVNANHSALIKQLSKKDVCTTPVHMTQIVDTSNTSSHGSCIQIMSNPSVNGVYISDVKLQPQIIAQGVDINTSQELLLSIAPQRDMEEQATHLLLKHREETDVPFASLPRIQPKSALLYNISANMVCTDQRDVLLNNSLLTKNTILPFSERLASLLRLHPQIPNLDRPTLAVSDYANDKTLPIGESADQHVPPWAPKRGNTLLDTPVPSEASNHRGPVRRHTLMDSNMEPPQVISLEESCDTIKQLTATGTIHSEGYTHYSLSGNHKQEYCIPMLHLDPSILDFTAVPEYVPHTGAPGPIHETPAQADDHRWNLPKYLHAALDMVIHYKDFFTNGVPSFIPHFLSSNDTHRGPRLTIHLHANSH